MVKCGASWALEREDPWPTGEWQLCCNEASHIRMIRVTDDVVLAINLCPAHHELVTGALEAGSLDVI